MSAEQLQPAIICDVDGTLCDVRTIRHYVQRPIGQDRFRPNFKQFHSESLHCPSFPSVVEAINDLYRHGYQILIVTAREARWKTLTEKWLESNKIRWSRLYTRASLDYRPDSVVKNEICTEIATHYDPRLAIDDRDDIIRIWDSAGIATLKVGTTGTLSGISWPRGEVESRIEQVVNRVSR